jgi:hypothetical protein
VTTNRIRPSSSLVDIAGALSQERMQRAGRKSAPNSNTAPGLAQNHDIQILSRRLGDLTKDVNLEDMHAVLQVRESVVREVLLWEFGGDFRIESQLSRLQADKSIALLEVYQREITIVFGTYLIPPIRRAVFRIRKVGLNSIATRYG